jgi:hypothetical protein
MQGPKTTVLGIEAGGAGVLIRITPVLAGTTRQKAWLGGSGAEEVTGEVEEGGALSSMVANGGGLLRFLSRERRERLDRERCEEGEKGADERRGWSVSYGGKRMPTTVVPW